MANTKKYPVKNKPIKPVQSVTLRSPYSNSRLHWAFGIVSLLLLVCVGFAATIQRAKPSIGRETQKTYVRAEVNPASFTTVQSRPRSIDDEDVDPATWRDLELVLTKPDGGKLEMDLLRPLWWIAEVGAEEDKTIRLSIPEMGVEGPTKVVSIKPMKPMKSAPPSGAAVVTGTFKHSAADVLDLQLEAEDKSIGVTYSHPFRSADRKDWVAAGELKVGERVETRTGTTKVVSIKKRPGQVPVYNLEVHKKHTYFVGKSGAWVHNSCALVPIAKFRDYIFKPGATHGKDVVFRNLGYGSEHSDDLVRLYTEQATAKFQRGEYALGRLDEYGQRITIEIEIHGIGEAAGKVSYLKTGWMKESDDFISLNTPFTGFTR